MSNKKIDDLLKPSQQRFTPLQRLLIQAANQQVWTESLQAFLPPESKEHCRVAQLTANRMLIHVDNAAWATRLRFHIPKLLEHMSQIQDFAAVTDIRIKVVPLRKEPEAPPTRKPGVIEHKCLEALADDLESGPLQDAVLRLAHQNREQE